MNLPIQITKSQNVLVFNLAYKTYANLFQSYLKVKTSVTLSATITVTLRVREIDWAFDEYDIGFMIDGTAVGYTVITLTAEAKVSATGDEKELFTFVIFQLVWSLSFLLET